MYTENTSIGELLELPQVMALLEKAAPQMVSGPAKGYLTPLTLAQLKVAQPESAQLADAILALANGADVDLTPLDPSKKKPILKGGSTVAQYDIDDVDGKMYMLNHAFSGCFILSFSKPIDEHIKGQVTYDGIPVKYILSTMSIAAHNRSQTKPDLLHHRNESINSHMLKMHQAKIPTEAVVPEPQALK